MRNFPTFTIITVTLNNLSGLEKTEKSIVKQSFKDFEWIVIDGKSTDKTIDLLREKRSATRAERYPFTFISEQDSGIYDAMNTGISKAKGHFLLFLNAGDELATAKTLEILQKYTVNEKTGKKPDFIYGDSLEPTKNKPIYKTSKTYKDIAWGMFTHHQAMLYRRHTIRDNKLHYSLHYEIAADYDFTLRFLKKSKKSIYIKQPICIFEQGGLSQKKAYQGRKEQYIIRENLDIVSQPKNLWILTVQSIAWELKSLSPALYRVIKSIILKLLK